MVRFMSVTVYMTISIVMTMLLLMMTVGMISVISTSIPTMVSSMISPSIPQAMAISGLSLVMMVVDRFMVMDRLIMVDRLVMVYGFMMVMSWRRMVDPIFLLMAVSPANEEITQETQKPGISAATNRPNPRSLWSSNLKINPLEFKILSNFPALIP